MLSKFQQYMALAIAAIGAVIAMFFRAKSAGKAEERAENEKRINNQAESAKKKVRNVRDNVKKTNDDVVADKLKSLWVRK